jgi:hypothetical protein
MRALHSFQATDSSGERRTSARTETSVHVVLKRGKRVIHGQAVDLSQTGILIEHPTVRRTAGEKPTELLLELPDGATRAIVRPVRKHGSRFAYEFVDLKESDQAMLTDYLFCQLADEPEAQSGVYPVPNRE